MWNLGSMFQILPPRGNARLITESTVTVASQCPTADLMWRAALRPHPHDLTAVDGCRGHHHQELPPLSGTEAL